MRFRKLNPLIWIVLLGVIITRTGTSLSIPFLTLFLHEKIGLSLSYAGVIVGFSFLAYIIGGFIGGTLSDRFGCVRLMNLSFIIFALTFFGFGLLGRNHNNKMIAGIFFTIINFISGISYSWIDIIGKSLISSLTDAESKRKVFSLRYVAVNIGSSIGPLIGAFLGISGNTHGFYVTATIVACYFIIFSILSSLYKTENPAANSEKYQGMKEIFSVLLADKALCYYIISGVLVCIGYIQQETLFGQLIFNRFHDKQLFSMLLSLNAILVITLQMPIMRLMSNRSPLAAMMLGSLLIALGIIGVAIADKIYALYIGSEIIFTLGEILVFSFSSIVTDFLAPPTLRGAYFGASGLQFLGRAAGPFFGGLLLSHFGDLIGMISISIIVLGSIPLYYKGHLIMVTNKQKTDSPMGIALEGK